MDIRMLGPLDVAGDAVAAVSGARQRSVLAVLLVRRGRVVEPDSLIRQLWGDVAPPSALTSVQIAVSKLRKALGVERIRTRPGGYELVVDPEEVDAYRFERLVEDGRAALLAGDAAGAVRLLRSALSLWRGEVLEDIDADEALEAERGRLGELRESAVEDTIAAELARGHHVEVVAEVQDLLRRSPFRERLHGHLILALYRSGRQAEALAACAELRRSLREELGVDPSPDLVALELQVLQHDPILAAPAAPTVVSRLPVPATVLIGRDVELRELVKLLLGSARLVSLTGPGGVGKTRLGLALLERVRGEIDGVDDVVFVDLSPLSDAELVVPTLANALGVQERGDRGLLDNVADAVGQRRLMVLLDNLEQVLEAAPSVAALLGRCPGLRVVVTSRERLAVRGEQEFQVAPLDPPDSCDELEAVAANPAVQMFCERVREVQRHFVLDERNVAAVVELCRRLDGLPLALELAAARVKMLPPAVLLDRLTSDRRLVLSGGSRDLPARHRALEATIGSSYDNLSVQEQQVLQSCAVFAGGAGVDAVEHVCADNDTGATLDALTSLLDKSLLVRSVAAEDTPRVTMLQTVRDFAVERLNASGRSGEVRQRHATYFVDLVAGARTGLWGAEHGRWMALLDLEVDNLRTVLDWSLGRDGDQLVCTLSADLGRFWEFRGALAEGSRWLTLAVERATPDGALEAALQTSLAEIETRRGEHRKWALRLSSLTARLEAAGQMLFHGQALMIWSDALWNTGDHEQALDVGERAVALSRSLPYPLLRGLVLALHGVTLAEAGDQARGLALLTEAEQLLPLNTSEYFAASLLANLSWAEIQNGRHQAALDRLQPALARRSTRSIDRQGSQDVSLRCNLGWAWLGKGDHGSSAAAFAQTIRLAHRLGDTVVLAEALVGLGCATATTQQVLASSAFYLAERSCEQSGFELLPYVVDRQREALSTISAATNEADTQRLASPLDLAAAAEVALHR